MSDFTRVVVVITALFFDLTNGFRQGCANLRSLPSSVRAFYPHRLPTLEKELHLGLQHLGSRLK